MGIHDFTYYVYFNDDLQNKATVRADINYECMTLFKSERRMTMNCSSALIAESDRINLLCQDMQKKYGQ